MKLKAQTTKSLNSDHILRTVRAGKKMCNPSSGIDLDGEDGTLPEQ